MNLFNILASVVSFIIATSLIWLLWNPVGDWIEAFDAGLRIFVTVAWFGICFIAIVYVPMMFLTADDKGTA